MPFLEPLTYEVPDHLAARTTRGCRVLLPFRQGVRVGVVMSLSDTAGELDPAKIRPIADLLDAAPVVGEPQLALAEWAAKYYHAPIGEAVRLAVPTSLDVEAERLLEPGPQFELAEPTALSDRLQRLCNQLRLQPQGLEARTLLAAVPGALHSDLANLEATGWATSRYAASAQRTRAKTVTFVERILLDLPPGRFGKSQLAALDALAEGPLPQPELTQVAGVSTAALASLEKAGIIRRTSREVDRNPFADATTPRRGADPALTTDQAAAVTRIIAALDDPAPRGILLHGVTGSGKTEVYMRATREVLARGRTTLILLPEIGLTPQFVAAFSAALAAPIAVLHSGLTPGERFDEWRRIRRGEARVVVGARSALFAPLENLGLLIVDEEHDSSFKQEDGVRYHARDLALVLGAKLRIPVVLGSATPALETLTLARRGKLDYLALPKRVAGRPLPTIDTIDMRGHLVEPEHPASLILSARLHQAINRTVTAGEQVILFLNRRGYAASLLCEACGESVTCADCDVAMTFHRKEGLLRCHYCDARARVPTKCPSCGTEGLERSGAGTERAEDALTEAFSGFRVGRLDRDSARGKQLRQILDAFRARELDILVGTQMLAKGHDFPNVTLVGILDADRALRMPDFRGGERAFQLFTQVAGRAGRAEKPGSVLIQTYQPDHFIIEAVCRHDYAAFAERELGWRDRIGYPPAGTLALVRIDSPEASDARAFGERLAELAHQAGGRALRVAGPLPATMARVGGRYRFHLLLQSATRQPLHAAAGAIARAIAPGSALPRGRDVRASIDIDPSSVL